jgi:hypothetical protein
MTTKKKTPHHPKKTPTTDIDYDDLFDQCLRSGLIEKTSTGYYFKPEFFDTLALYNQQ